MPIFRAGAPVKFKSKQALPAEIASRVHLTSDGYLVGVYLPTHEARTPEVRDASGKVTAEATTLETAECIYVMTPDGHNVMVPFYGKDGHAEFRKLTFAMSEVDDPHNVDAREHMPPGRVVHKDWQPTPRKVAPAKPPTDKTQADKPPDNGKSAATP